jgi:phage recombination protein Bet
MNINNSLVTKPKNNWVIEYAAGNEKVKLSPEIVKNYLVSGDASKVTEQEIVMFMNLCKFQELNPFLREAYLIKYGTSPATLVTGKTAYEKRAYRNPYYLGFRAGIITADADRNITEREGTFMLDDEKLVGGWAEIYVKNFEKPVKTSVSLSKYIGRKSNGEVNSQWASKPATMIRKVAKCQALREAFPDIYAGLYTAEECGIEERDSNIMQSEIIPVQPNPDAEPPRYDQYVPQQKPENPAYQPVSFDDIMGSDA